MAMQKYWKQKEQKVIWCIYKPTCARLANITSYKIDFIEIMK